MEPIDPQTLLAALNWRYATKTFDPSRVIPESTWRTLEEALILTPSSYGLQPWRFIVVVDAGIKQRLRPHSWNQAQVTDCSHYVVFASIKNLGEKEIDRFIARAAEVRNLPAEAMASYRGMMVGDIVKGPRSEIAHHWAAQQAYIALGNFMTAAALLQVDTCPMEGFIPAEYDKILDLGSRGLTAAVCCAAGYRSAGDKYAGMPKVRFPHQEMVERI
jgi:nitroreductase